MGNPTHLLDTSTFLWIVGVPRRLSGIALGICRSREFNPAVSVISLMEIIVKAQKGHLVVDPDPLHWWKASLNLLGYSVLPIRQNHVEHLWNLPPIHKDPADRLLIAQAISERIPLVTSDAHIHLYPVESVW